MENIVCQDAKNYALTTGKSYEVLRRDGNYVIIDNDNGRSQRYYADLFVEETAQAAPRRVLTEADMIATIRVNNNTSMTFQKPNGEDVVFTVNRLNTSNRAQASCGIGDCDGINSMCSNIDNAVDRLGLDDDYSNLRKALLKAKLNNDIHVSPQNNRAMYIISTAVNDIEDHFKDALADFADITTDTKRNPNSGNDIKTWIVYANN